MLQINGYKSSKNQEKIRRRVYRRTPLHHRRGGSARTYMPRRLRAERLNGREMLSEG